jgi:hypothetical protein
MDQVLGSALALLVLLVLADHSYDAFATDDFTFGTHFLD